MCNSATVTMEVTDENYDSYCEGYYAYDKDALEKAILDVVFDGHFWEGVGHYLSSLDISEEARNVLFELIRKQTVVCVSAPELT